MCFLKKKLLVVLPFLLFIACVGDHSDTRLRVVNKSKQNIYVSDDRDTMKLNPHAAIGFMLPQYYIRIGSSIRMKMPGSKSAWESNIRESAGQKLHLYVFSEDTLKIYTTQQIVAGNKFLKRIDISLRELKLNNWEIVYSD